MKACLAILLVASSSTLYAQNDPLVIEERAYVRPFSAGVQLGIYAPTLIPDEQFQEEVDDPPSESDYFTEGMSVRGMLGANFQFTLGDRWALNFSGMAKRLNVQIDTNRTSGVNNPNIPGDERNFLRTEDTTKAWFLDVPVMLRIYSTDHYDRGTRAFFGFGGSVRRVFGIQTSIESTNKAGDKTCCDTTPAVPNNSTVVGATAGFGVQFIDDFGIRSVPEVRYTRWMNQVFQNNHMHTRQDQLEFIISFGF